MTADGPIFLSSLSQVYSCSKLKHPQFPKCQHHPTEPLQHLTHPPARTWMVGDVSRDAVASQLCFQSSDCWLFSGLTLTSSGVGNSGIFPPNSRVFPPLGRNLHDCYLISASKWGRFLPGHSFYCFPPPHLHPNINVSLPFLCRSGRPGFNQNTSVGMDTGSLGLCAVTLSSPKQ